MRLLILFISLIVSLAGAENVLVKKVIDGDTIRVVYNRKTELVRLIGIDAPEHVDNERARRSAYHSGRSLKEILDLGHRSSQFLESKILKGSLVKLEFDQEKRDHYGRLLGYIYLSDGKMVNEEILRMGYAQLLTVPPNVQHLDKLRVAARDGRELGRGLWSFEAFRDASK